MTNAVLQLRFEVNDDYCLVDKEQKETVEHVFCQIRSIYICMGFEIKEENDVTFHAAIVCDQIWFLRS